MKKSILSVLAALAVTAAVAQENTAIIVQNGNNNEILQSGQEGFSNEATIVQTGNNNASLLLQLGNNNTVDARLTGNSNIWEQIQFGNDI